MVHSISAFEKFIKMSLYYFACQGESGHCKQNIADFILVFLNFSRGMQG
jgi:hypothetical protein